MGVLAVTVFAALIYMGLVRSASNEAADKFSGLDIAEAVRSDIEAWVSAPGVIEPKYKVDIKSKASGEILEIPLEEGDEVKKGDILIKLDPAVEKRSVSRAKAGLSAARAKVSRARIVLKHLKDKRKRAEELYDTGDYAEFDLKSIKSEESIARQDLRLARAELKSLDIELKESKERFDDTIITSPISGLVLARYVEVGQIISSAVSNVSGGTTLMTIADLSELRVNAEVDEADVGRIAPGQKAIIRIDAFSRLEWSGVVERVSPQGYMESNVTTFRVIVVLDESDSNKLLKPMMSAEVEILAQTRVQVVIVPTSAIRSRKAGAGVLVVGEDGGISWRAVDIGVTDGSIIEIIRGIEEGDEVIIGPVPEEILKEKKKGRGRGWMFKKKKK